MVHKLIAWATTSRAVVILLVLALLGGGLYSFFHVNVEAYPDPAPAIVEVVAQYPSASSEEVERLVTIPLEAALAGIPGLTYTRSRSLFQLGHLRCQFDYGVDFNQAKQEVLNRLATAQLPAGVTPVLSPETPTGEIYRYTLSNPKDSSGRPIYTLNDLKALEDWSLERVFPPGAANRRRVQLWRHGQTLRDSSRSRPAQAVRNHTRAIAERHRGQQRQRRWRLHSPRGRRSSGPGHRLDRRRTGSGARSARRAGSGRRRARYLREEEDRRLQEIRDIGLTATNNVAVRVNNVVEGGRVPTAMTSAHREWSLAIKPGSARSRSTGP